MNRTSELKHTPTPWIVTDFDCVRPGPIDPTICQCNSHWAEVHANAEFIVRACNCHEELLEVLEKTLEILTTLPDGMGGVSMFNLDVSGNRTKGAEVIREGLASEVRQAIAKAKVMNETKPAIEEPDPDEPSDPQEPEVWTRVEIRREEGKESVTVRVKTNDDNDDGYPDLEIVRWTHTFPNLEAALKQYGKSHYGVAGHRVDVFVDGKKV